MRHSRKADRHKENGVPANAGTPLSSICSFILTHNHRSPVRIRPQAPKNSTRQGAVFLLSLPGFEVYPPCGEIRPQAPKNSTRQGAVFGLPKSLSLRASPQTGAAIRFQNVQFLRLFAGLQLKDYGFPRRFAPRSKCPWGTDWRGNPSYLRAGCHTRL